jgi:5-methylcytosine-specific restriction endonuclease McrA
MIASTEAANCRMCSTTFLRPCGVTGRRRGFCSLACRRTFAGKASNARARQRVRAERSRTFCIVCEAMFSDQLSGPGAPRRRCCSQKCRVAMGLILAPTLAVKKCADCNERITARSKSGFCRVCRLKRRSKTQLASAKWREGIRRWQQRNPDKVRAYRKRADVIRRGVVGRAEYVDPKYIFDRDNWVCQLCHKKVRPYTGEYSPRQASIDHILPLARGGAHAATNLQTACRRCNSSKLASKKGQYRLF